MKNLQLDNLDVTLLAYISETEGATLPEHVYDVYMKCRADVHLQKEHPLKRPTLDIGIANFKAMEKRKSV